MSPERAEVTDDAVLDGTLRLLQPRRGHRFGHDAILLAASVPARAGDRVADLGAGVGAAGLALLARVRDIDVTLVEIDPQLTALAAANIERNGFAGRARAVTLDAGAPARAFAARHLGTGAFDHVMMNPPFNRPADPPSPDRERRGAHSGEAGLLAVWIRAAGRLLASGGTLTLIWRADGLADVLQASIRGFGGQRVQPVHGRADEPAMRVIVSAVKGSRTPMALLPGFSLNDAAGPTAAAERVMRAGAPLPAGVSLAPAASRRRVSRKSATRP